MGNTMAASRVSSPIINRAPQEISHPPTNGPMISGAGIPIFAKRPAPKLSRIQKLLDAFRKKNAADQKPHKNGRGRCAG